jgi:Two component regulator propeller
MYKNIGSAVLILFVFVTSFSAAIKDTSFVQEYHKPFPFQTEEQNDVRTIVVDSADNVWAGTKSGLFKLNRTSNEWESMLDTTNQGPIYDLFVDSKNTLWIAAWNGLFRNNHLGINKISDITKPINVVNEINGSVIAMGHYGIWTKNSDSWHNETIPYSKSIRDLLSDGKGGYYVATVKGLYHKTADEIIKYQTEEEILSDNLFGMEYTNSDQLWVGGLGGISVYENDKWIQSYTPENGLPTVWVKCIKKDQDGKMWVGTTLGVTRYDGKEWSLRHSRRWLINDEVNDIAFDKFGNAWLATSNGVSAIMRKELTLEMKEKEFRRIMKKRHIREPYLVEKCRFENPGDTTNWLPLDNDNDGQYTSMYLAMESYRYAVTNDPDAKINAKKAFNALQFLQSVTETKGFVARTVIPSNWKRMANPNKTFSKREWADLIFREPRMTPVEDMWRISSDGKWLWKRGTSSDEITGHMYGYLIYYDLVAEGDEKERVKNHILKIVDYIIEGDYVLIDIDGKPTRWGVWAPEYLNDDPDWATERGINSVEILSYLKLAFHVSGDDRYQEEYYKLLNKHNYRENILKAKSTIVSWRTYIDDELLALAYPALLQYETDSEIKSIIQTSIDQWYNVQKNDDNPYFQFLYNGLTGKKFNTDRSLFLLQDNPLDLIRWKVDNSKREDLQLTHKPILENIQTSRLVPPSERGIMRWDDNPWEAIQGDGGHSESDGVYWMLAYWTGRYYDFIE